MAVDTRNKRMSLIGLDSPVPTVLPHPDGDIGTQDRAMLLWLYHGLSLLVVPVIALTLPARSLELSLNSRNLVLALPARSLALSLLSRSLALKLASRSLVLTLKTRD